MSKESKVKTYASDAGAWIDKRLKLKNILVLLIAGIALRIGQLVNELYSDGQIDVYSGKFGLTIFLSMLMVMFIIVTIPLYYKELDLEDKQDKVLTEKTIRRPQTVKQQMEKAMRDLNNAKGLLVDEVSKSMDVVEIANSVNNFDSKPD